MEIQPNNIHHTQYLQIPAQDCSEIGDDIIYDDCGIDWATIADESEAERLAGKSFSFEELERWCNEDLPKLLELPPLEFDAAIEKIGKD